MATKIIGLDLGTHSVKMVLITAGLRSIQIVDTLTAQVEPGEGEDALDAAARVAIAAIERRGWNHYPVGLVLPGVQGSYRLLRFPFPDARRIGQAVAFEADGQFPVALDKMEHDHIVLPPSGGEGRALVVAARKDVIARVSSAFDRAHIDVKLLTVSPLALAQVMPGTPIVAAAPHQDDGHPLVPVTLIVDIGHRSTDMIAMGAKGPLIARVKRRGGVHLTRAIAKDRKVEAGTAEEFKMRDAFLPSRALGEPSEAALQACKVVARAFEPTVREIQHTRMWMRAEFGYEVTSVQLAGGTAHLQGIAEYLGEQLELPISHAHLLAKGGLRKLAGHDWTTLGAALGGALGATRRPHVQLYTELSGDSGGSGWFAERLPAIATMGLAILAFGALDTLARLGALEAQEQAYRDELGTATKDAFGEAIYSEAAIKSRLTAVLKGQDVTSKVWKRGAVEVLAALVKVSAPAGPKPLPGVTGDGATPGMVMDPSGATVMGPAGPGTVNGVPMDDIGPYAGAAAASGFTGPVTRTGPDGTPITAGAPTPGAPATLDATATGVDPTGAAAGAAAPADGSVITWEDELYFTRIDIRPLKMELRVSAKRTPVKDFLQTKLESLTCVNVVNSGKVRDENERKTWDVTIDHDCYNKSLEVRS